MTRSALLRRSILVCSFFAALPLRAAISYSAPTFVNTGSQPTYIVVADFNGDCSPDFATANAADVTVRFGDGSGGFPTTATITGFSSPRFIAVGDFNGDGKADLVVGDAASFNNPTNSLVVLLNNGSGTLTAQPKLSLDGFPAGIAVGDFNGDGHLDVMAGENSGTNNLAFFAGDGTGAFAAATHPTLTISSGSGVNDIVAGDWNGDGRLDLAIATFSDVFWMTGNGDGTFNAATHYTFPNTQGEGGAVAITAADVDHDGDLDVATAGGNVVAGATVFINNGSGVFTAHQMSMPQAPANPVSVRLADLDGDGNIDIVTADQFGCTPWGSNLAARPGNGDGTFGAAVAISVGYGPTCLNSHWQPQGLGIADLNCDGKMDIIAANSATGFCSVLLTTGGSGDSTPPVITAPPPVTVSASGNNCSAMVSDQQLGKATATDNCSICVNITRIGVPQGNIFPSGTTLVTYTANDGHGNSASATQSVTVTDSTPPAITAPPNITAIAGNTCTANVSVGTPTTSDNCSSVTTTAVRSDSQPLAAAYPLGTTTISWTAKDAQNNTATATQTVTVNAPPLVFGTTAATPASLWPPNHKIVDVTIDYAVTGGCGPAVCAITGITSSEPVNGAGDGNTPVDWSIVDGHHVKLRAERTGTDANPRIYTITIACTANGSTTTKAVTVSVAHN